MNDDYDPRIRSIPTTGRKTPRPVDLYEGVDDLDAWSLSDRYDGEGPH